MRSMMVLVVLVVGTTFPQTTEEMLRVSLSGGMGVVYMSVPGVTDLVSQVEGTASENTFKSAVVFFGAAGIPFHHDWVVKIDYGYLLGTQNAQGSYGANELTYVVHMPTAVIQYVLTRHPTYNVKAGFGLGYHVGILTTDGFSLGTDSFSAGGIGALLELEANTALGEDLFAYLGAEMRLDGFGPLVNDQGNGPMMTETTLDFFGMGARLGVSYYF